MGFIANNDLKEYIQDSELRVVVPGLFHVRMSKDIAKRFDSGLYDIALAEHKQCINELQNIGVEYPDRKKPIFYLYIVPDNNFVKLLNWPINSSNVKGAGCQVPAYDTDGFDSAFGSNESLLVRDKQRSLSAHIVLIHEYSHLILNQFKVRAVGLEEGFAELVPWYVLDYEKQLPLHLAAMKSMKRIYTINNLLNMRGRLLHEDFIQYCSFQPSYMSAYLWTRAVVEHIRVKYSLSRIDAIKKFLDFYHNSNMDRQWFVRDVAENFDMDYDKLLNSTEYQTEVINQIEQENKNNIIMNTKDRDL